MLCEALRRIIKTAQAAAGGAAPANTTTTVGGTKVPSQPPAKLTAPPPAPVPGTKGQFTVAGAMAWKPSRDWSKETYAGPSPGMKTQMSAETQKMLADKQKELNKGFKRDTSDSFYDTLATNAQIYADGKQATSGVTQKVHESAQNRADTAKEHATGFANLHARLDRAMAATQPGIPVAARKDIMSQPVQVDTNKAVQNWQAQPGMQMTNLGQKGVGTFYTGPRLTSSQLIQQGQQQGVTDYDPHTRYGNYDGRWYSRHRDYHTPGLKQTWQGRNPQPNAQLLSYLDEYGQQQ